MLSAITKAEIQTVREYEEVNHLLFRCVKKESKGLIIEAGRFYTYRPTGKSAGWVSYPVAETLQEELFFTRLNRAKQCKNHKPNYYDPTVKDDFRTEKVKLSEDDNSQGKKED